MIHLRVRYHIRHVTYSPNVNHNNGRIAGVEQISVVFSAETVAKCWDHAQDMAVSTFGTDILNGPFKMETRVLGSGEPSFQSRGTGRKFWTEAQARSYDLGYLYHAVTETRDLHDFSQEGYLDSLKKDAT